MLDRVQVQIVFSVDTKYGSYQDALYINYDEYPNMTQENIEVLKQERVNNWIFQIENPAPQQLENQEL